MMKCVRRVGLGREEEKNKNNDQITNDTNGTFDSWHRGKEKE